jgi:hypothetical protein
MDLGRGFAIIATPIRRNLFLQEQQIQWKFVELRQRVQQNDFLFPRFPDF